MLMLILLMLPLVFPKVLFSVLFFQHLYTSPFASITSTFSVPQQQFADDSQLYISLSPSNFLGQIHRLEDCVTALRAWCCHNSLSLKPDNSDSVLFGTRQRSHSFSDITTVNVAGSVVPMADHVRLLGVTLDNRLSMVYCAVDSFCVVKASFEMSLVRLGFQITARSNRRLATLKAAIAEPLNQYITVLYIVVRSLTRFTL